MTLDKQLTEKSFFETFMVDQTGHPIEVLGELYWSEQKNDMYDLSFIRFAQAEVYFHNKDYEAAIFKWENINNELAPWAKKNMADAYSMLGLLSTAEDLYTSIQSDSQTLNTEVGLHLFSLYVDRGKLDDADSVIKKVVLENPDYPNVSEIARSFYEEHGDWRSAVDLAITEGIRTESRKWFDILKSYIDNGYLKIVEPEYFRDALISLYQTDKVRFEGLVTALWNHFQQDESYLLWIHTINTLLIDLEISNKESFYTLSELYKNSYFRLINGKHFLKDIYEVIPNLLDNWIKVSDSSQLAYPATAVLAWNEFFPSSLNAALVSEAESAIQHLERMENGFESTSELYQSILNWAQKIDVEIGERFKWAIEQIENFETQNILIAGTSEKGKTSFINHVIEDELLEKSVPMAVMFKDGTDAHISEITDLGNRKIEHVAEFKEILSQSTQRNVKRKVIEFKRPSGFLRENKIALIETPCLNDSNSDAKEVFKYIHVADSMLFVLDAASELRELERDILQNLREQAPGMPIHFLLNITDEVFYKQEMEESISHICSIIQTMFPNAKIYTYSSQYKDEQQLKDFVEFLQENYQKINYLEDRNEKFLFFIRSIITNLLEKRLEIETNLGESINWNEDMLTKISGAINQVDDLEKEKIKNIQSSFRKVKEEIKQEIETEIPKLLKNCSEFIREDSDFRHIHVELDDEMNKSIKSYLDNSILPKFMVSIQNWIDSSSNEFQQSQSFLDEMRDGFNSMYGEDKLTLSCDFKVLDDWRRDCDRMTAVVQFEKVNVLSRFSPGQFLLKSAGKLFGGISQNNTLLYNKYVKLVETEDYHDTAVSVSTKFLQQFELFERALDRDIKMFFRMPLSVLNATVEESQADIQTYKETLANMKARPEIFHDPLTLFEIRLRQYEWMNVGKEINFVY